MKGEYNMDETAKPSNEGSGTNRENYKEIETQDVSIEEIEKKYDEHGYDDVRLNVSIHHTISNVKNKSNIDQTGSSDTDDTTSGSAVISDEDASVTFEDLIIGKAVIPFPLPKQNEKIKNNREAAKKAAEENLKDNDGRETE
jgi:hypothetical protein